MFWISHSASTSAMKSNLSPSLKQWQTSAKSSSTPTSPPNKAPSSRSSSITTRSFWSRLTGSSTATTRTASSSVSDNQSNSADWNTISSRELREQRNPSGTRRQVHFLAQQAPERKTETKPIPLPAPHWRHVQTPAQIQEHTEAPTKVSTRALTEDDCNGTLYLSSGELADFQLNEYDEVMPVVPVQIKVTGKEPRWLQPWEETDEGVVYGDVFDERPSVRPRMARCCRGNPHTIVEVAEVRGRSRRRRSPPPSEELIDWL